MIRFEFCQGLSKDDMKDKLIGRGECLEAGIKTEAHRDLEI